MSGRNSPGTIPFPAECPGLAEAVRGLSDDLGRLYELLRELVSLADAKLDGLRSADAPALHDCSARELLVLERLFALDEQRQASLARVAQALQAPELSGAPLSAVVARLPEPLASVLRARNAALREIATQLQKKNKLAAEVAHRLQSHVRAVLAAVATAQQENLVYGPRGQHEHADVPACVDAVG